MKRVLIFFLFLISPLGAIDRAPWFPRYLELQPRATYQFQYYEKIDTKSGAKHRASCNNFLALSIGGSYDRWAVEFETNFGATRHRTFTLSDIDVTGRYLILDDIVGDPVSLSAGLTVMQVLKLARNDVSCFYHGGIQLEAHLAVGKELNNIERFWKSRVWSVFGLGIADLGSAWLRTQTVWETNCWDRQRLGLSVNSLWGLGHNGLSLKHRHHFRGYGSIRHQSIDLSVVYSHFFEMGLWADIGYAYRIYAHNCPMHVNQVVLSVLYPFGL